ncbi:hypothetical protein EAE99_006492 [Botrytis elliptica]|nr:hypothetical protein EAE99_006492 [Botrytis elliptica]
MKSGKTTLPSWYDIVNDYTTRRISVKKDLLVGISAIAKVMAEEMGQPPTAYKAGLWEHDFLGVLLWRRLYECDPPLIRHAEYIAPSWSWASISASDISTRRIYENEVTDDVPCLKNAKIIEIIIENDNDDHFGIVKGGYVKLSGPTLEVCRHAIPSIFWDCPDNAQDSMPSSIDTFDLRESVLKYASYGWECGNCHPKVLLVNISTLNKDTENALMLQNTGSLDVYQRIGCLKLKVEDYTNLKWTTREITII